MTHTYTGPTTFYGLKHQAPCRIIGRPRRGGVPGVVTIQTEDGRTWIVQRTRLEVRAPEPPRRSMLDRLRRR